MLSTMETLYIKASRSVLSSPTTIPRIKCKKDATRSGRVFFVLMEEIINSSIRRLHSVNALIINRV